MRFLCQDKRTREYLRMWSGKPRMIFVDHYFWYAGTPLQKSHLGLLQSILYQILSSARDLDLWDELRIICAKRLAGAPEDLKMSWSRGELVRTIQSVRNCTKMKICVFVDGLDEYYPQSEHSQLVTELQAFARISNIKLCVSSRPWTIFEDAFGKLSNRIRLQDLTRPDIVRYVSDHLEAFPWLFNQDDLVRRVSDKAKGVFLWVYLVVAALKERINAGNNSSQLFSCLEEFPDELEDYFRQSIHRRINGTFRNETAQALKMALLVFQHQESTDILDETIRTLSYMNSFLPYWLLHEGINASNFAQTMKIKHVTRDEINDMMSATVKHLDASCKDFLFLSTPVNHDLERSAISSGYVNQIHNLRIEFLHRTVYDFLRLEEMTHLLNSNVPAHFTSNSFLFNVSVACVKVIIDDIDTSVSAWDWEEFDTPLDVCLELVLTVSTTLPSDPPLSDQSGYLDYFRTMKEIDKVGYECVRTRCNKHCWTYAEEGARKLQCSLLNRLADYNLNLYAIATKACSSE